MRCSARWCAGPPRKLDRDAAAALAQLRHRPAAHARRSARPSRSRAFPSWFLRITCDRCGKDRMLTEAHAPRRDLPIRDILKRMRHDGCGGRPGRAELLTGIEGASSRPVRRIVLIGG